MNAHLSIGKVSANLTIGILASRPTFHKPCGNTRKRKRTQSVRQLDLLAKADLELEKMINDARINALSAKTNEDQTKFWSEMVRLIKLRSNRQIKRMENRMELL
jgi:hypothetical protein